MQNIIPLFQNFAQTCQPKGNFLGVFPTWYKYLNGKQVTDATTNMAQCVPEIRGLNDIWLVLAAVTDMLLRIAVLVAIGFVIAGGIKYMSSQGMPDKTAKARDTIVQAVVGLVLALAASTLLTFVAGRL